MNFNCFIIIWYFIVIFISRAYLVNHTVYEYAILIAADFQEQFDCNSNADKDALTQMKRILSKSKGCKLYVGNILDTKYGNQNISQRLAKAIQILRYLDLDFIMFGINEVAYGESVLTRLVETFGEKIPFNNAKFSVPSNLPPPQACPAIIGYASDNTGNESAAVTTKPSNVHAHLEALAASYKQKKHVVIAMGCQNTVPTETIVKETSSIIMIINGCENPELGAITLENSRLQTVVAVSPQSSIHYLTKIFIRIKHDGKGFVLDEYNVSKIAVRYRQRTSVERARNKIQPIIDSVPGNEKSTVLGNTMVFLNGQCYRSECNFGSLIADAFVQYRYNNYRGSDWTDTAIALVAAGTIFTSINATTRNNTIYREDIEYALYNDKLVTIEISGMDIRRSLNHGFDVLYKQGDVKFLQVSGLRIIYDPLKQSMQKLISVKVRTKFGVPMYILLTRSEKYYVIMTKSLANGDFGHKYFKEHGKIVREENMTVVEAVCRYISELKNIYHFNGDRILVQASLSSSTVKLWSLQISFQGTFVVIITCATIY